MDYESFKEKFVEDWKQRWEDLRYTMEKTISLIQ